MTAHSTDVAKLADELFAVVASVYKNATCELFEKVAELDLSITQVKALHLLEVADGELSLKTLGEQLGISFPAVSRSVEALHQRGLVVRREDEADRRMKRVRITDAGVEIAVQLNAGKVSALRDLVASLSEEQRRRLAAAIAPIAARPEVVACRPRGAAAR